MRNGGYEVETIDECPTDLICNICLKIMRNAVQFRCGHGMCKTCYENLFDSAAQRAQVATCPECRQDINSEEIVPASMINRIILSLKVKCKNHECAWMGELSDIEKHEKSCEFEMINCTNAGCTQKMPRNLLNGHLEICTVQLDPTSELLHEVLQRLEEQEGKISQLTTRCQEQQHEIQRLKTGGNVMNQQTNNQTLANLTTRVSLIENIDPVSAGFFWVIPNFDQVCEVTGDFYSPYFMTSLNGYKCRISMSPGRSKNSKTFRFGIMTAGDGEKRHFNFKILLTFCGRKDMLTKMCDSAGFQAGVPPLLWFYEMFEVLSGSRLKNLKAEKSLKVICNFITDP